MCSSSILSSPKPNEKPHYHGHRIRLRQKFLDGGSLADYEQLELLLTYAIARRDVKPLAKTLLSHYGSLGDVLLATPHSLKQINGVGDSVIALLQLVRLSASSIHKNKLSQGTIFSNWEQMVDYCFTLMAGETVEQFRVIFLNTQNKVLDNKILATGTVNHTPAYPREIVKYALNVGATAVVLVHNHPSGNPNPSREDLDTTYAIKKTLKALDIIVHDHIIIAKNKHVSLKNEGLL